MDKDLNILLVTTDEVLKATLRDVLERESFHVRYAQDISGSVDALRENGFHIALVDATLSSDVGGCVHDMIEACSDVAVVLMIGESDSRLAVTALREGAYDFLIMPLDVQEIPFRLRVVNERRKKDQDTRIYHLALENRIISRTEEVFVSREKIRKQFISVIQALQKVLQARHIYTESHSRRVAKKSVQIARLMNLSEKEVNDIEFAALFHDLGKIGIKDDVLNKPSRLDDEEYEHMKLHPIIAAQILTPIEDLADVVPIIKHEHERYDGQGYPDGLKGEDVPLGARIIAVADTWDSLIYDRIYRRGCSREDALAEIQRCSGTQFDPRVVQVFVENETRRLKEKEKEGQTV